MSDLKVEPKIGEVRLSSSRDTMRNNVYLVADVFVVRKIDKNYVEIKRLFSYEKYKSNARKDNFVGYDSSFVQSSVPAADKKGDIFHLIFDLTFLEEF